MSGGTSLGRPVNVRWDVCWDDVVVPGVSGGRPVALLTTSSLGRLVDVLWDVHWDDVIVPEVSRGRPVGRPVDICLCKLCQTLWDIRWDVRCINNSKSEMMAGTFNMFIVY